MATAFQNVVQNAWGFAIARADAVAPALQEATGPWLRLLVNGPEVAPNAAYTAMAGISQDIVSALTSHDYTLAWDDFLNACSTILYGYLDGNPLDSAVPFAAVLRGGLPPAWGLLTNPTTGGPVEPIRGGIENVLEAESSFASDIAVATQRAFGATPAAAVLDAHGATLESLLTGIGSDLSTLGRI